MFDRKMTNLLQTAFLNTYTALQEQCHEHFYFAALILDHALIFPLGLMKPMRDLSEKTASVLKNKRGGNGI